MEIATPAGEATPEPLAGAGTGLARLAAGLLQGLYLYLLYRAAQDYSWPANEPLLFAPLLLVGLLFPLILVASLGHMHFNRVSNWAGLVAAVAAALGAYDAWRVTDAAAPALRYQAAHPHPVMPSAQLGFSLVVGVFIAHSLVMAGARERRRIASYHAYFDTAWKNGVQLAFSGLFVGAVWLVLFLGAELFLLVKLDFLHELLGKAWFAIPTSTFAFACALHLTDVRPAIVRGIRGLLLVLMSWVLPVMTLIVGAFLLSLPFTGLASLWATRHAAAVLLSTAGAFVVLVNAAYQDGAVPAATAVRLSMRAACLLLVPITAIAIYALGLRVADYGWTDDRIVGAACMVVAGCYALGYAWAALPGRIALVSRVNVATAFVVLATLLLLLSPVADPARLSVDSQLARLASGKVPVAKFDFGYLRFNGARYGRDALARLDAAAAGPDAALLRSRIAAARKLDNPWQARDLDAMPADIAANVHMWPKGAALPASFLHADWSSLPHVPPLYPACLRHAGKLCDAFLLDTSGDRQPEMIVVGRGPAEGAAVFRQDGKGAWSALGVLPFYVAGCASIRSKLIAGEFRAVQPVTRDLEVGNQRIPVEAWHAGERGCPKQ